MQIYNFSPDISILFYNFSPKKEASATTFRSGLQYLGFPNVIIFVVDWKHNDEHETTFHTIRTAPAAPHNLSRPDVRGCERRKN